MESHAGLNRVPLLVSIAVAVLGSVLLAVYMHRFRLEAGGGSPIALVALRRDVTAGEPMVEDMLIVHDVPESYVESRQIHASELPKVLGIPAAIDLEVSHTLAWTDLRSARRERSALSTRVPAGMRAMSVAPTGQHGFGRHLRPGDRVDVLLTKVATGSEAKVVTVPLLQNILVLAVGPSLEADEANADGIHADSVTLLLTVDQAGLLAQAKRGGQLSLPLRNPSDLEINEGLPEIDDSDVLDEEKRMRRQRRMFIERVR